MDKPEAWFRTNPRTGTGTSVLFYFNVFDIATRYAGVINDSPDVHWVVYVDALAGCNMISGGGTSGVTIMSAQDLRGFNGEQFIDECTGLRRPEFERPVTGWIGGLGHEMGHTFGLPHPPGCDQGLVTCDSAALMWLGYASWPNTYLRLDDKATLRASPFFFPPPPISQTITFGVLPTVVVGGTGLVTAAGGGSLNPVIFTSTTTGVCTVGGTNGSTVAAVTVGMCTIAANQAGNANYSAAPTAFATFTTNSITLIAVASRKMHGVLGQFNMAINKDAPLAGAVSVESRGIGSGHNIAFQFSGPVSSIGSSTAVDTSANTYSAVPTISNNEVTVTLTGVPDNKRVTVSLYGVNASLNVLASIGFLVGDVNGSRSVNAADISAVKANVGKVVGSTTFKFDLNATGSIAQPDVSTVKARSGLVLP